MNAGRLIREICEDHGGSSGGHGSMAGARLPLSGHAQAQRKALKRELVKALPGGVRRRRTSAPVSLLSAKDDVIYWDHNATAPLRPEVATLLARGLHAKGGSGQPLQRAPRAAARRAGRLDAARAQVARVLGCEPKEVVLHRLRLRGGRAGAQGRLPRAAGASADAASSPPRSSTPRCWRRWRSWRSRARRWCGCAPGADGRVRPEACWPRSRRTTALCSLMWANNETGRAAAGGGGGARLPGSGASSSTRDAVQAAGKVPREPARGGRGSAVALGAQVRRARGVGVLVVRQGRGRGGARARAPGGRAGAAGRRTCPTPRRWPWRWSWPAKRPGRQPPRVRRASGRFEREVLRERCPGSRSTAASAPRVPNTSNLRFDGADGEALLSRWIWRASASRRARPAPRAR